MGKFKTIMTSIGLLLLTAAITVVPWGLYEHQLQRAEAQPLSWHYSGYQATTITDRELAQMFFAGNVSIGGYPLLESGEDHYTAAKAHDSARRAVSEAAFVKEPLTTLLEGTSAADVIGLERLIGMVVKDGRPIVLCILQVTFLLDQDATLDLVFEEKTGTVLWMMYSTVDGVDDMCKTLATQASMYFGEALALYPEQYIVELYTIEEVSQMYAAIAR